MVLLFPLYIRSKYQEYASYVNIDKRNWIHSNIQIKRIKLKEGIVSRSTKICKKEVLNKEQNLLEERSTDTLLSKDNSNNMTSMISAAIWHWMHCYSALPYTTF